MACTHKTVLLPSLPEQLAAEGALRVVRQQHDDGGVHPARLRGVREPRAEPQSVIKVIDLLDPDVVPVVDKEAGPPALHVGPGVVQLAGGGEH
jgi:hypothetical protein